MKLHPDVKIQVYGRRFRRQGLFAALQNGQTDIADASRAINAKEQEACVLKFGAVPTTNTRSLPWTRPSPVYVNTRIIPSRN